MRRRDFIKVIAGSAAACPLAAHAQQPSMPVIGFLNSGSPKPQADRVARFLAGLKDVGYTEGQNVAIEYRWANGQYDQEGTLAAELVALPVTVFVASGGVVSALAAKAATRTIPIVFIMGDDPVRFGLVASLNRPGGNITGTTQLSPLTETKRLELLRELAPGATTIGVLVNPHFPGSEGRMKDALTAASTLRQRITIVEASSDSELETASTTLIERRVGALSITSDPFFNDHRDYIVVLAAHHRLPTMYSGAEYTRAGGLISYGPNIPDSYREGGLYAGRILKGEKPADLPIVQATKFEFVINLKTAKALSITIPDKLLAIADEVIE
jgi:putative ABC transport system substrate-binding protein